MYNLKISFITLLIFFSVPVLSGKVAQRPYMFINEQQINRAKQQVVHNEDLKRSVESLQQTLEKNLRTFLTMSLRSYHVPEDEIKKAVDFIGGMDIRTVSERVMHELFKALAMRFEFTL